MTRGLCPLDSSQGRRPYTPPKCFALWKPSRGAAPAPRKGHRPLTHCPEILKDFRGVLFEVVLYIGLVFTGATRGLSDRSAFASLRKLAFGDCPLGSSFPLDPFGRTPSYFS